jgi:hypothetical protein
MDAPAKTSDPLGAGTYLFSNREWRDPSSRVGAEELAQGFRHLEERFPSAGV